MPQTIRIWHISENHHLNEIPPGRLELESKLEDWLEHDISIISDDLLVIGRQVPTDFGGYIDLLCLNANGDVVIVELKRDKTHREITAQVLDYASWVNDLSRDRIDDMANEYLGSRSSLDDAFRDRFHQEIPDVVNDSHQIIIVASAVDPSSERIIKYLSDVHGLNINAVTFQCFKDGAGTDLLGRVFLIEPKDVEMNVATKSSSRRKPNLTYEQLEQIADDRGVGGLYRRLVEAFSTPFDSTQTTRSNIQLVLKWDGGSGTGLNLIPEQSNTSQGVRFQLYSVRLARVLGVPPEELESALPPGAEPWKYHPSASAEFTGVAGYFKSFTEAEPLIRLLSRSKKRDEPKYS